MNNLDNIHIILVEPQTPQNIGSAARAMKNMGLKNLYLINPVFYKTTEAYQLGCGAQEIIDKAKCFDTLDEALKGIHFVVGTSQRKRKRRDKRLCPTPKELAQNILTFDAKNKVAILFGRESTGLTKDELALCNVVSTIPHESEYPSLNLSQAVLLYCYEIFDCFSNNDSKTKVNLATFEDMDHLYKKFDCLLKEINFKPRTTNDDFMYLVKRILGRTFLEKRDVQTVHLLLDLTLKALSKKTTCPNV